MLRKVSLFRELLEPCRPVDRADWGDYDRDRDGHVDAGRWPDRSTLVEIGASASTASRIRQEIDREVASGGQRPLVRAAFPDV